MEQRTQLPRSEAEPAHRKSSGRLRRVRVRQTDSAEPEALSGAGL
jgi:hypothetical protein